MKDKLYEQLSALVDDELPDAEQALLIRQLSADNELQGVLSRYQLVRDALHDNLPRQLDAGFHERVHAALQQEAVIHAAPARAVSRWYRPLAGMAIAASVAIVAVGSLQSKRPEAPGAAQELAAAPSIDNYIRAANAPAPVAQSGNARGLDVYLVNHNEYAVNRGMQGMLPYVRLVGQDMQPDSNTENE